MVVILNDNHQIPERFLNQIQLINEILFSNLHLADGDALAFATTNTASESIANLGVTDMSETEFSFDNLDLRISLAIKLETLALFGIFDASGETFIGAAGCKVESFLNGESGIVTINLVNVIGQATEARILDLAGIVRDGAVPHKTRIVVAGNELKQSTLAALRGADDDAKRTGGEGGGNV